MWILSFRLSDRPPWQKEGSSSWVLEARELLTTLSPTTRGIRYGPSPTVRTILTRCRMPQLYESIAHIPKLIKDNETVGAGISSWVHRLDAVAKCYTSNDGKERDREIAVFERLCSDAKSNILRYYGVWDRCVILQFARHGSIRQYLRSRTQTPSLSVRLRWAEQVTDAISFLHSKGILHCDISCNNIFLDDNFNAMVGDFAGSSIDGELCLGWYETSHSHPDTENPSEKTDLLSARLSMKYSWRVNRMRDGMMLILSGLSGKAIFPT